MPIFFQLAPFIPFLAMIPPSLAAMWIASRWLKNRKAVDELQAELATLREDVAELRQAQADAQERLDFTERLLSQVRDGRHELQRPSS
jgi:chromosome segregation ATPase